MGNGQCFGESAVKNHLGQMRLRLQRGFTAIEMMVVMIVSIAALALGGQWLNSYSDNMLNQSAAEHAKTVADAATRYIKNNYSAVTAVATPAVPASITVAMLQATNDLPASFSATNPYGQSYSILALEPTAGQLQTLIITTGGETISELSLRRTAQLIGAKGGYVSSTAAAAATGSYGGWSMPLATYGVAPGVGHLAVALFFQDGSLVSDYVYRNQVPGHPELNTMNTPLIMAAVNTLNGACSDLGAISRDAVGKVLSCNGTNWKSQGSAYWEDPVANYATLTGTACNATSAWQTRVVQTPTVGTGPRAYTCDGTNWKALAVDNSGNLTAAGSVAVGSALGVGATTTSTVGAACVSGAVAQTSAGVILYCDTNTLTYRQAASGSVATNTVQITGVVTENAACPNGTADNGRVARDTNGLILSCQSGVWLRQRESSCYTFAASGNAGWSTGASATWWITSITGPWYGLGRRTGNLFSGIIWCTSGAINACTLATSTGGAPFVGNAGYPFWVTGVTVASAWAC